MDLATIAPKATKVSRPSIFEYIGATPSGFEDFANEALSLISSGKLKVRDVMGAGGDVAHAGAERPCCCCCIMSLQTTCRRCPAARCKQVQAPTVYQLSESSKAHEDLQGRKTTGKLVIAIPE